MISNKQTNILAFCLLLLMFLMALFSMAGDSLTMDEQSHLPAGYSYLTQKDMRINPEHPPLIKDLAAFPLLFIKGINFPSETPGWKDEVNGQWTYGSAFLFSSGNPADEMIFWGRLPMILMLMLLGLFIFKWSRELYGNQAALLALFLFSFSPTFIAHGRLVTTDVGAATGVLIASYYFVKFLKDSSSKNIIFAGLALGFAELTKFSLILLVPTFVILFIFWAAVKSKGGFLNFLKVFGKYLLFFILILAVAGVLIWAIYQYNVWNYPPERQAQDTQSLLRTTPFPIVRNVLVWVAEQPVIRPLAHYFLGLAMVFERASGGHTMYFLGEVSNVGWKNYFPFVYIVKEPLAMHLLTIIALFFAVLALKPSFPQPWLKFKNWAQKYIAQLALFLFFLIYWAFTLKSNLNLGVRHLLPILPIVYILVSGAIIALMKPPHQKVKYSLLAVVLIWQAFTVVSIYPSFLSYFNEIVGGPSKGYLYSVDSNYDWGQDLKRLVQWTEKNKIDKIYVDYFGGASAKYYLKDKFQFWAGDKNPKELPPGSYLAISASPLQIGQGLPGKGFDLKFGYYGWLNQYEPVARIGYSIFVYRIN